MTEIQYLHKGVAPVVAAVLAFGLIGTGAVAGPIEDGLDAYRDGDFEAAVSLWQPPADQGYPEAQYYLGFAHGEGQGVEEDDAEAVRWLTLSADQGYAPAQFQLGLRYSTGEGVEEDDAEGMKWYRMAAEQGHPDAQMSMAVHYEKGDGVPQDREEAYAWVSVAAAQGSRRAGSFMAIIEERITLGARLRALELAEKYWNLYVVPFQN